MWQPFSKYRSTATYILSLQEFKHSTWGTPAAIAGLALPLSFVQISKDKSSNGVRGVCLRNRFAENVQILNRLLTWQTSTEILCIRRLSMMQAAAQSAVSVHDYECLAR